MVTVGASADIYATIHSWCTELYLYDQLRESLGGGVGKQKPGVNSAL